MGTPTAGSTQCQAWAENTMSAAPGAMPAQSSKAAVTTVADGTLRAATSAIAGWGSTAVTARPRAAKRAVALPVPAPTSTTVRAPGASERMWSTAASGYEGRLRS